MQEGKRQERQEHSRHPGMIVVHIEQGLLRAQVIKAKLEGAGIPVLLDYESLGRVIGITVDGLGEVRVLVPAPYAGQAQMLIEEQTGPCDDEDVDASEADSSPC